MISQDIETSKLLYRGKHLNEYSKDELIEIVAKLSKQYSRQLERPKEYYRAMAEHGVRR